MRNSVLVTEGIEFDKDHKSFMLKFDYDNLDFVLEILSNTISECNYLIDKHNEHLKVVKNGHKDKETIKLIKEEIKKVEIKKEKSTQVYNYLKNNI